MVLEEYFNCSYGSYMSDFELTVAVPGKRQATCSDGTARVRLRQGYYSGSAASRIRWERNRPGCSETFFTLFFGTERPTGATFRGRFPACPKAYAMRHKRADALPSGQASQSGSRSHAVVGRDLKQLLQQGGLGSTRSWDGTPSNYYNMGVSVPRGHGTRPQETFTTKGSQSHAVL